MDRAHGAAGHQARRHPLKTNMVVALGNDGPLMHVCVAVCAGALQSRAGLVLVHDPHHPPAVHTWNQKKVLERTERARVHTAGVDRVFKTCQKGQDQVWSTAVLHHYPCCTETNLTLQYSCMHCGTAGPGPRYQTAAKLWPQAPQKAAKGSNTAPVSRPHWLRSSACIDTGSAASVPLNHHGSSH